MSFVHKIYRCGLCEVNQCALILCFCRYIRSMMLNVVYQCYTTDTSVCHMYTIRQPFTQKDVNVPRQAVKAGREAQTSTGQTRHLREQSRQGYY